ncbi:DUF1993 family protein [Jeongeupia sp. USM3]|uniref:DUF1993 domain-containing protein n=1 Tax=Jeongeupia sp. USM3 TaxID=1906741 RepID=UPI000AC566B7|nr:DUF1993 domain-containing protein [Jeongeupia sp. USM3]
MPLSLHQASVPVFVRYLDRLAAIVAGVDPALLDARLAPDMHPFRSQVAIAANFAPRACFPLAGKPVPDLGEMPQSVEGLLARIAHAKALVESLAPDEFDAGRVIEDGAGQATVVLPAADFLCQYALPNFFFHLTTAYAILRSRGVAVGKGDFDGFHAYPR